MAFGNWTLTGQYFGLDGVLPAVGRVQIDGIPQVIADAAGKKTRVGPRTVILGTQGDFSITLPSNATTGNSTTIGYRVTVVLKHQNLPPVEFYAPAIGSTLDIATVTPSVVAPVSPFIGPAGPAGPAGPVGPQGSPGAGASGSYLNLARNPDLLIVGTITRDANGAATSASVTWPDGTPGTYTATTLSSAFPGAVDAYQITYGSPVTKTYTQPTITRDPASGAAVNVPAVTVA